MTDNFKALLEEHLGCKIHNYYFKGGELIIQLEGAVETVEVQGKLDFGEGDEHSL